MLAGPSFLQSSNWLLIENLGEAVLIVNISLSKIKQDQVKEVNMTQKALYPLLLLVQALAFGQKSFKETRKYRIAYNCDHHICSQVDQALARPSYAEEKRKMEFDRVSRGELRSLKG